MCKIYLDTINSGAPQKLRPLENVVDNKGCEKRTGLVSSTFAGFTNGLKEVVWSPAKANIWIISCICGLNGWELSLQKRSWASCGQQGEYELSRTAFTLEVHCIIDCINNSRDSRYLAFDNSKSKFRLLHQVFISQQKTHMKKNQQSKLSRGLQRWLEVWNMWYKER